MVYREIPQLTSVPVCRLSSCLLGMALLAALAACNPEPSGPDAGASPRPGPETVVARVGDDTITVAHVEHAIRSTPRPQQFEYVSPPLVRELVDNLVDQKLMAAAGRAIGLATSEQLAADLAAAGDDSFKQERILAQAYLNFALEDAAAVSDEAIGNYYSSHLQEFTVPERVRLTRVVLPGDAAAAQVIELLRQGYTAEAIKARVEGPVQAGVMWLQQRGEPGPMQQQAFALQAGEISKPFPVATGLALVRVEERRAAHVRPLAEVRPGIVQRLAQEGRSAALAATRARLRAGAEISVDEKVLAAYAWEN